MFLLYIIGAILALVFLILLIRVRLIFSYGEKLSLKVGALFINYDVLKKRPKKKAKKKSAKKKTSKSVKQTGEKSPEKKNMLKEFTEDMDIGDFLDIVSVFFSSLGKMVNNHLYVRLNKFRILVGGEDPAKSAIQFGAICQSCTYLFEVLNNFTKLYPLEKSEVSVHHDFSAPESEYELTITVKLRIIHLLGMLLSVLFEFIKIKESKTKPKGNK